MVSRSHDPLSRLVRYSRLLTLAGYTGAFRIYRAPASVAFLSCGTALKPILPKSECWCIAEDSSVFVIRIRKPQYWRIEVPVLGEEDIQRAHVLREVFDKILQFEKTPCPFQRSFTVELPERPHTPVKRRPWTPKHRPIVLSPPNSAESSPTKGLQVRKRRGQIKELPEPIDGETGDKEGEGSLSDGARDAASEGSNDVSQGEDGLSEGQSDSTGPYTEQSFGSQEDLSQDGAAQREVHEPHVEAPSEIRGLVSREPSILEEFVEDVVETSTVAPVAAMADSKPREPEPEASPKASESGPELEAGLRAVPSLVAALEAQSAAAVTQDVKIQEADIHEAPESKAEAEALPTALEEVNGEVSEELAEEAPSATPDANDNAKPVVEVADGGPVLHEAFGLIPTKNGLLGGFQASRSVTAPPQLSLVMSPPSKSRTALPTVASRSQPTEAPEESRSSNSGRPASPATPAVESTEPVVTGVETTEPCSPTPSSDSFHSVQSWHSPITPPLSDPGSPPSGPNAAMTPANNSGTFPYPHEAIPLPTPERRRRVQQHNRDVSDLTVTPGTHITSTWDDEDGGTSSTGATNESASTAPEEPEPRSDDEARDADAGKATTATTLSAPSVEPFTSSRAISPRPPIRHRVSSSSATSMPTATATTMTVRRRALSPLPPAANLFSPPSSLTASARRRHSRAATKPPPSRLQVARRLPLAIVSKTCEILLSPPGHLIGLMLRVAARIAAGEWRGLVFGEGGERVAWGDYPSEEEDEAGADAWDDVDASWSMGVDNGTTDGEELRTRKASGGDAAGKKGNRRSPSGGSDRSGGSTSKDKKGKGKAEVARDEDIFGAVGRAATDGEPGGPSAPATAYEEESRSWEID